MKIIDNILDIKNLQYNNKSVGFVPTMGALHQGHISLIKEARKNNEIVIVSVFVNPTQFLEGEDFDKYPRTAQSDIKICELCEVNYLFMPNINDMYGEDEVLVKAPNISGFVLEGLNRPGHFDGMLQIVLKLLLLISPTNAYFGKKDAQQLFLIKKMVKNFYLKVNIIECDIIREDDGLALSSRNRYLSKEERELALNISFSLKKAAKLIGSGEFCCKKLYETILAILNKDGISIEYIAFVDREFNLLNEIELKNSIILIAVKIGKTRLIDNIWI